MSVDVRLSLHDPLHITVTRGQALALARLVRASLNKKRRLKEHSDFVPEEGKRDAALEAIRRLEILLATLVEIIGPGFDLEDGGRPSRRQEENQPQ